MAKLAPSRLKYPKIHKGRIRGKAQVGNTLAFGDYAIQSLGRGRISASEIEAARVAINRFLKRNAKVWIRIFPHKAVTKKPAETRMGKGKGPVDHWCAVVKPGTVLFEVSGCSESLGREAMRRADGKLSVPCRFLSRDELSRF